MSAASEARARPAGPFEPQDELLMAAFLAGEPWAVEQVRTWLRRASAPYRARLASWDDAQQELLLETTRVLARGAFRGEARLKTYLWKVASHTCLNLLRSQARRRWCELDERALELQDPGTSALDGLLRAELGAAAVRLVGAMPAECRRLWALLVQGLSYRQMAAELGVAEGALRVRVCRCRRKALRAWKSYK